MNKISEKLLTSGDSLPILRVWADSIGNLQEFWELIYAYPGDKKQKEYTVLLDTVSMITRWVFSEVDEYKSYIFELSGSYPIAKIITHDHLVSDMNTHQHSYFGLANMQISYSLNRKDWVDANPIKLANQLARYIRIQWETDSLIAFRKRLHMDKEKLLLFNIQFVVGQGLACEIDSAWTDCFHRYEGWTGSDGIYSISYSGQDVQTTNTDKKTMFVFGDTFIGSVDTKTKKRISQVMINNTLAVIPNGHPDPDAIAFIWSKDEEGQPQSAITPLTPNTLARPDCYYWLQDGINIGGMFYCFPLIIGPNPDGPEGFEFELHGIVRVNFPLTDSLPRLDLQQQVDTNLCFNNYKGFNTYFGAALMANTHEALVPQPDGFIYIYGIQQTGTTDLVVARVSVEQFEQMELWTYWDGLRWNLDPLTVQPVAREISCELSITPMIGGMYDGKYVIAYMKDGLTPNSIVSLQIGDSPVGPFEQCVQLYYCDEPEQGDNIYAYNAKAHPHLSKQGELLVSYNVNTSSWDRHLEDGSVYRPRFVRIFEIK